MSTPIVSKHIERAPQPSPIPGFLTTAEISARAGVTQEHVGLLIRSGKINGVKIGHDWLVEEASWDVYQKSKRPWGARPGKRKRKRTPKL